MSLCVCVAADRGWLRQYFVNYLQLEQVQHLDPDEVEGLN
eukprot:SAG11_NODE_39515_length_230_cov_2.534351_1_plen_39_part_01